MYRPILKYYKVIFSFGNTFITSLIKGIHAKLHKYKTKRKVYNVISKYKLPYVLVYALNCSKNIAESECLRGEGEAHH